MIIELAVDEFARVCETARLLWPWPVRFLPMLEFVAQFYCVTCLPPRLRHTKVRREFSQTRAYTHTADAADIVAGLHLVSVLVIVQ